MRIALAQLDPVVGDVAANADRIIDAARVAVEGGADVVVTPELAVLGYPPRDLILRTGVVAACEAAVAAIARAVPGIPLVVGHPRSEPSGVRGVRNSASVCHGGRVVAVADKQLLPGYDVFDEDRYFDPGTDGTCVVDVTGRRLAVLICEDLWAASDVDARAMYDVDPLEGLGEAGLDAVVTLNASPFVLGKIDRHHARVRDVATALGIPVVVVNQCGANDDLIFDGRSFACAGDGGLLCPPDGWDPDVVVVETTTADRVVRTPDAVEADLWNGLVRGVRSYVAKSGHRAVRLGLSGGIDSALTAVIAVGALGPERVAGVLMPSRYSSRGATEDAVALAKNMGMAAPVSVPIEDAHADLGAVIGAALPAGVVTDVADENLQARLRGLILMTMSNASGDLVLATSNKSELAVGYSTLYGDMCGALSVIGDLTKTQVYALARWINAQYDRIGFDVPPIPEASITKPPSAELRPDQTDQDTLPPYDQLDPLITARIERDLGVAATHERFGADPDLARRVGQMVDRAEYKRHQAAVILKVTPRAFGRGRPMPIAARTAGLDA